MLGIAVSSRASPLGVVYDDPADDPQRSFPSRTPVQFASAGPAPCVVTLDLDWYAGVPNLAGGGFLCVFSQ